MNAIIAVVLAAWLVVSILSQFSFKWFERVRHRDVFGLLPLWTYFAPNPGQSDYHLVCRDKLADGRLSQWREVEINEPRKWYSLLWNPEKRGKKVLVDAVQVLAELVTTSGAQKSALMLSTPYLLALNVVSHLEREPGATHRQFAIVETFGFTPSSEMEVLLVSGFHALPRGGVGNALHASSL
jgi:hypothetical protein